MEKNIRQKRADETIVKLQRALVPIVNKLWQEKKICFNSVSAIGNERGNNWTFAKLLMWSGSIVEEGFIKHEEIISLTQDFERIIKSEKENFFGYFHGDTMGDHIYVGKDKTLYLMGMRIVPRPGKNYYDFLRALDWIFLKAEGEKENLEKIIKWIKQYLPDGDREEVKLVFALRCIGILGWDMLHRGDYGKGNFKEKKKYLLKFIRREY